jgi:hypothetical protein
LENIIHIIEERKLHAYCVHETWLGGYFEQEVKNGMKFIHHWRGRTQGGAGMSMNCTKQQRSAGLEKVQCVVFRGGHAE